MALLGPEGMRDLAIRNMAACQSLKAQIQDTPRLSLLHPDAAHYNEFAISLPGKAADALRYLDDNGIIGGFDLSIWYPELTNQLLVCATDQTSSQDIDSLIRHLGHWAKEVKR